MEIASAFVLAALIAAVVFANYAGGSEEIARRFFQVAIAATLAFCAISGTTAFLDPHSNGSAQLNQVLTNGGSGDLQDGVNRGNVSHSMDFAIGVLAMAVGIGLMRRYSTIPLGVTLGGLLLILFAGATSGTGDYVRLLAGTLRASREVSYVNFAVTLGGFVVLLLIGLREWEQDDSDEPADHDEDVRGDLGIP